MFTSRLFFKFIQKIRETHSIRIITTTTTSYRTTSGENTIDRRAYNAAGGPHYSLQSSGVTYQLRSSRTFSRQFRQSSTPLKSSYLENYATQRKENPENPTKTTPSSWQGAGIRKDHRASTPEATHEHTHTHTRSYNHHKAPPLFARRWAFPASPSCPRLPGRLKGVGRRAARGLDTKTQRVERIQ